MARNDGLIEIFTKVFEKQLEIETKINEMNNDLQTVKHNSELMKNHISFIQNLYQTMRKPIHKLCSFFS